MANEVDEEYFIRVDDDQAMSDAVATVEALGGRPLHRFGRLLIARVPPSSTDTLKRRLPAGARLTSREEAPISADTIEAIGLEAARLRSTPAFRQAKAKRPHEGKEWGTEGLLAPDADIEADSEGGKS